MSATFVRPPTAQAAVLAELRRRIGTGQLRPGAPIRQDPLAEELGVSRHPVREALRVLEGEGHIHHEPHRGYFVAELGLGALVEIYRMRDLLESEALRVAVPRTDDVIVARMRDALAHMRALDPFEDMDGFVQANREFHFAPLEAAGMPRLLHHIHMLWEASDAYRTLYYMQGTSVGRVHDEHEAIVVAVAERDGERAVEEVRRHREHAIEGLRSLLRSDAPSPTNEER
ncbi:GntR family transcriptional regulator [Nitriliruptor alkaliphilus]|uniref:GntR family transcriptional regulator n=1 Tax=Nitriliruptor alkaliphilus TaxID=427918 RepID=UPI001B804183|nr:GntR family transcriptional regulator [Nitriliruptor alkaliphilus]